MKPAVFKLPKQTPSKELRLGSDSNKLLDGGVSYKYIESQLNDSQSPLMLNLNADDRGALTKRKGQRNLTTSLGAGGINGAYNRLYKNKKVFAWGDGLYTQDGANAPVKVFSGLANAEAFFVAFNDILYMWNSVNFIQWDGATAKNIDPYIPTLFISTPPAGGGTAFEDFNLLGTRFKQSFSGDGTATVFQLALSGLDATLVTAVVGTTTINEGSGLTVNRTTGTITFTTAPPTGVPNNVVITASKTVAGMAERIKNCRFGVDFGGANDTRLFVSGNQAFPNRVFRCGVADASYWPENQYNDVGSKTEAVNGLAKHYDKLITLKERSLFFTMYQDTSIEGFWGSGGSKVTFPTFPINSAVGCDMPNSIQIIDNNVVFGHSETGIHILVSTALKDERNVSTISGNINGDLYRPGLLDLSKADLQAASSVDHEGKYWLCVGNKTYVWDYRLSPYAGDEERLCWFPYDNINAKDFIMVDRELYYGDRSNGLLVEFITNYNDFGNPINGVWKSKLFNFNLPDFLKTIKEVWITTRSGSYSEIAVKYYSENGELIETKTVNTSSFSWARFAWDTFNWAVSLFAPTLGLKPKIKKVIYFQIEFSNNLLNQNLSILSLVVRYDIIRKVK